MTSIKSFTSSKLGLVLILVLFTITNIFSQAPSHDPSRMIYSNGRYYVFSTGQGIWVMSSSNSAFTDWRAEPSPFANGNPSWISQYVSGFGGVYWAPECIYMNGKYYLYYSVSMGARPCAIGVTTTTSLSSPSWSDQGMVVYSDNSTPYGSIDPDVFFDQSGRLWLAYGSHLNGIALAELNKTTGKPLNSTRYNLANNDCEAASIIYNGGYYYLFFNRYDCCAGYNSNYTIFVGRSTSVTGPYLDKNGVNCTNNGGSIFLQTNGRYIGPGHFGFGNSRLTYHFYDGNDNGNAKLMSSTLGWSGGWPVAAVLNSGGASITSGYYRITNRNSGKVLDVSNCSTADGGNIQQWTSLNNVCQSWYITHHADGYYTLRNENSGKYIDAAGCGFWNGTNINQWTGNGLPCQQFSFVSVGGGYYRIVNRNNGKDVEVTNASTADGANVQSWSSNGCYCQHWSLTRLKSVKADNSAEAFANDEKISIYPTCVKKTLNINGAEMNSVYKIYAINGKLIKQSSLESNVIDVSDLTRGIYVLKVDSNNRLSTLKFIKE
jgi:arabinan endo-1,5-alpha-L-arabinosidase